MKKHKNNPKKSLQAKLEELVGDKSVIELPKGRNDEPDLVSDCAVPKPSPVRIGESPSEGDFIIEVSLASEETNVSIFQQLKGKKKRVAKRVFSGQNKTIPDSEA